VIGIDGIGCCWYFGFGICETVNPVGNVVNGGDDTANDIAECEEGSCDIDTVGLIVLVY
jgi:hypothetical protein